MTKKTKFLKLQLVLILLMGQVSWAEDTSTPYLKTTLQDGARIFTSPLHMDQENAKVLFGAGAIVGVSMIFDEDVRDHLYPHSTSDAATKWRRFGDAGQLAGPVIGTVFAVHGASTNNEKSKETAFLSYESFIWAGAAEGAIKFVVGRERPSKTDNPFIFKPGSGDSSFPSGHTTEAFAAATVFSEQYPYWAVIIPSYAAASAVGFSRMYANQHWMSDVVAGAMLGTAVSHYLRKWHRQAKKSDQTFEIGPGSIRWVMKF